MGTYEIHKNVGVCNKSEDENNFMKNKFKIFPVIAIFIYLLKWEITLMILVFHKEGIAQGK
jgi:hypothetical protein